MKQFLFIILVLNFCCDSFAQTNIPQKQRELASLYYQGEELERKGNYSKALSIYKKAYKEGDVWNSPFAISMMYVEGRGVTIDMNEAFKWCKIAADEGNHDAEYSLSIMYYQGLGVQRDLRQSFLYSLKAAEGGVVYAMENVQVAYYKGEGTSVNLEESFKWLKKAAEHGDSEAYFALAIRYIRAIGCTFNDKEAEKWMIKAAESGNVDAQYSVGLMYEGGTSDIQPNKTIAVSWFEKAASQGHSQAAIKLQQLKNK